MNSTNTKQAIADRAAARISSEALRAAREAFLEREEKVSALLDEVFAVAGEDLHLVAENLDARIIPGYGAIADLETARDSLQKELDAVAAAIGEENLSALASLSMLEQIQVEEFFAALFAARKVVAP